MTTAEDLRAERARLQIPLYRIAGDVGLHPTTLGQILSGRKPLTVELAERIAAALRKQRGE